MQSDFTFVLHCANCGLNGEIDEYTLRYQCPECKSEMKLSHIKTNIPTEMLRTRLSDLQLKKMHGDFISGRIFALLADSTDPTIRNLIEEVVYERYCRDHGIPIPKSAVKSQPKESAQSSLKKVVTRSSPQVHPQGRLTSPPKKVITTPKSFRSPSPPRNTTVPKKVGDCWRCDGTGIITTHTDHPHLCHVRNGTGGKPLYPAPQITHTIVSASGDSEVTCPYCGTKKIISNSFIGLYTRCRCGRTFPTETSTCRPISVMSTSVKKIPVRTRQKTCLQKKVDYANTEVTCPYCGTKK